MGLQDALFLLGLPFDCDEAPSSPKIQEEVYFTADVSCQLAVERGSTLLRDARRHGELQFDAWGQAGGPGPLDALRERIKAQGLRNSLLLAIAPTGRSPHRRLVRSDRTPVRPLQKRRAVRRVPAGQPLPRPA